MDLKSHVILTVEPNEYYKQRFPKWSATARPNVSCIWHEDTKPSLSVALINGGAKCHTPGCAANSNTIGNIVHFESRRTGLEEVECARLLYSEFVRPCVPASLVATLQTAFVGNRAAANLLLSDAGITVKTAKLLGIGYQERTHRYAFPVFDRWGNIVNYRLYKLPRHRSATEEGMKVINLVTDKGSDKEVRYGANDLYPWQLFLEYRLDKPLVVMPSEKECILGIQDGMQCVCSTAGEGSWDEGWNELFVGYDIAVMGQNDKPGKEAAEKRFAMLQTVANSACIVYPPELKDYADWRVKKHGEPLVMIGTIKAALRKNSGKPAEREATDTKPKSQLLSVPAVPPYYTEEMVELSSVGSHPASLNKLVKTQGVIAAKATVTFTIPWRFRITVKGQPQKLFALPIGRDLLRFIRSSDAQIKLAILDMIEADKVTIEYDAYVTATEVEIIPIAAIDRDVRYVTQRCIFIGDNVDSNVPYDLEIVPTNEMRTQETVGIVVSAKPIARSIETASFTDGDIATLQKYFRPEDADEGEEAATVWSKLMSVADDVCNYQSKIYNRPDWHLVALLTWLSPIAWKFPYEKEIQRGWLNSLALGDTETGKSKVSRALQRMFGSGAFVNAENCTYVGLVGGAIKMGSGQFMLRWGRIPLADRQLVVVEELSGLSVEEISNLSEVRSSGVARLDKGGISAETLARTRLLALSNVRPVNRTLASYLSGVKAVQELIGHGEDIARFDLICTLVDREVSTEVINRPTSYAGRRNAIPDEAWKRLGQFAWALTPDKVQFTTDAYTECLDQTKRLSEIYHAGIPLFKGGSGRYKIARVAAAIAMLQFAWDGKKLKVLEEHVIAAVQLLQMLYDKPSLGYLDWSKQMHDRDAVKDVELLDKAVHLYIPDVKKRSKVMETLIHSSQFTRDELCAVAGLTIMNADLLLGVWLRERVLRKGLQNVWEITIPGRSWMLKHV